MSLKLLGFALLEETGDHASLAQTLQNELKAARDLLGANIATLSCVRNKTDLVFLRACIELRIPTIVLLPEEDPFANESESKILLEHLLKVALAHYVLPPAKNLLPILEWSDALICIGESENNEFVSDAIALGIPLRKVDFAALASAWTYLPQSNATPKHGFPTRRELLDFLDQRFS